MLLELESSRHQSVPCDTLWTAMAQVHASPPKPLDRHWTVGSAKSHGLFCFPFWSWFDPDILVPAVVNQAGPWRMIYRDVYRIITSHAFMSFFKLASKHPLIFSGWGWSFILPRWSTATANGRKMALEMRSMCKTILFSMDMGHE